MGNVFDAIRTAVAWVLRRRLVRAALMYSDNRGGLLAAAITFRMLFAVFAAVLLGFSAASIWLPSQSDLWEALVATVDQFIPGLIGTGDDALIDISQVRDQATSFTVAGVISVVALIWALVSAVGNVRVSLRVIAGTQHKKDSALFARLLDLLFALSVGVLVIASAAVTMLGSTFTDTVLGWLGYQGGGTAALVTKLGSLVVTFLVDAVIIAWLFWLQSGLHVRLRTLVPGSLLGGAGLVVLQQLSSLFVGGADKNPLLATFASLVALLLWFNFSAQVVLIASAFIVVSDEEQKERVSARYGAETFAQRSVRAAERDVRVAEDALVAAREAEEADRERQAALRERLESADEKRR